MNVSTRVYDEEDGPISKFFLILFVFFINANHLTGILNVRMYLREATTKRTGPNDAFLCRLGH